MQDLQRDEVQQLLEKEAQVVEVLGREEFDEDHLPGAISIPLRQLESKAPKQLDKN